MEGKGKGWNFCTLDKSTGVSISVLSKTFLIKY
jgi:hypothetical protein